jgi:hypothetical protein
MSSNFRDEELVKVQGKQYPLVGGRLRLAHEENTELSISTNPISITEERVVIQASVQTAKGSFSGLGNASAKRDRMLSNALIELAETRAIARALRFAGYGVEFTGFEEMPDDVKDNIDNHDISLATKAQLEAIASIARNNNISAKQLHEIMHEVTGKDKSKELTIEDASELMTSLRRYEKQGNSKIS